MTFQIGRARFQPGRADHKMVNLSHKTPKFCRFMRHANWLCAGAYLRARIMQGWVVPTLSKIKNHPE